MLSVYAELRPLVFSIAYRMLGSVTEAEDITQEAFLRFHRVLREGVEIVSPKAYLSTVATRLSIDQLRSARKRRERYVGQWLPEPLLTDAAADVSEQARIADSLSLAFLVLLESLSPVERAVFLLHDVFCYGYDEIAQIVGKTEPNCRQLASRARRHIAVRRPRSEPSRTQREQLAQRFFAAVEQGDTAALITLLTADVAVYGDGGGKAPSWPHPIVGRDRVGRLLIGLGVQVMSVGAHLRPTAVNGQPGALVLDPEGRLINVLSLDIANGLVQTVRSIINPDKLGHLGPLADVPALLQERRGRRTSDPRPSSTRGVSS